MSFADFSQRAEDHTRILVLVLQAGSCIKPRTFSRIFDRIAKLQVVPITTSGNPPRVVRLRYRKYYAIENNAWGDFQVHRRVLGLITIGQCERDNDLIELFRQYEQLKEKYESTLLDSRLVIFGDVKQTSYHNGIHQSDVQNSSNSENVDPDNSLTQSLAGSISNSDTSATFADPLNAQQTLSDSADSVYHSLDTDSIGSSQQSNGDVSTGTVQLNPSHVLRYPSDEECPDLEDRIQEFLAALFWVLESKRLDRSYERLDHLTLLTAPFELRKDTAAGDTDSRMYKKRCQGRQKKHVGDLCLLAGVPGESILHYQTSIDLLRSANDFLWLAGAYEGLASASVVLLQLKTSRQPFITRNFSFSLKRGLSAARDANVKGGNAPRGLSSQLLTPNLGLDLAVEGRADSTVACLPEDILDNYKEAVINYSKFKDAGVIEMEASLKACRVLIAYQRILAAADFLQNIIYINVQLMEEEKVQQFLTLANLYHELRMMRKASFYYRIAAMRCVLPTNPQPSWSHCYHLLIQALSGYQLSLDPKEMTGAGGWVSLQLRVLHELVYTARRMGNAAIAIRHLSFLLHAMFDSLTPTERTDLAGVLRSYTSKCEGTALSIALDDGTILSPVPFLRFPTLRSLKLIPAVPHHRPVKIDRPVLAVISNPFIYSPLQLSPVKDGRSEIIWVEGDMCEASMNLYNPLPFDINVSNLVLTVEGAEINCPPISVSLRSLAEIGPVKFQLVPKVHGQLTVTGYTMLVLGIKNHCRLREIRYPVELCCLATVVPRLPLLQVATSLPKSTNFSTMADSDHVISNVSLTVYAGQRTTFDITVVNNSKIPVERIDLMTTSSLSQALMKEVICWSDETLKAQLPLQPAGQAVITVTVTGLSDCLSNDVAQQQLDISYESELVSRFYDLRHLVSLDSTSGTSSLETLLMIQYSGGAGLQAGYCRQCSVSLTIDIVPALNITHWSVTPGDSSESRCLALDVVNHTSNGVNAFNASENRLQGASECQVLIEAHCSARLSIPLPAAPSTCDNTAANLRSHLGEHVRRYVDVRWNMPTTGVEGQLCLDAIDWTLLPQCALLRYSHVSWVIEVDGKTVMSRDGVTVDCYRPLVTSCMVRNCSDVDLVDVTIQVVSVEQLPLSASCVKNFVSESRKITQSGVLIGCVQSAFSKVSTNTSVHHKCSLLFTTPGLFQLTFLCRAVVPSTAQQDSPGGIDRREWLHLLTFHLVDPDAAADAT